jgi:hypothetical protein
MCVLPVAARPLALFEDRVDRLLSRRGISDRHELRPAEVRAGRLSTRIPDKEAPLAELLRQARETLLDRTVEVPDCRKVLRSRHDVALGEQRHRLVDRRVDLFRVLQFHALRALEKQEVPQRRLAERHECQCDASRKVTRRGRQARAAEVRSRTDRRQQILYQRQVQHLLRRDVGNDPPPSASSIEFLRGDPLVLALLERAGSEQVLTHDPVLELGRLAEHVDQRLTVLDHKRCLGVREATARSYDLSQPPPLDCIRVFVRV